MYSGRGEQTFSQKQKKTSFVSGFHSRAGPIVFLSIWFFFSFYELRKSAAVQPGQNPFFSPEIHQRPFHSEIRLIFERDFESAHKLQNSTKTLFYSGPKFKTLFVIRTETQIFLNQMLENHYLDRSGLSYTGLIPIKIDQFFKCTLQRHVVRYVATKLH